MAEPITLLNNGVLNTNQIAASANAAVYNTVTVMFWTLIIVAVFGGLAYWIYKKSFKVHITILDNTKTGGVSIIKDGLKGKITQDRPGELRFKIWKANKQKIRYNQEAISPGDFYREELSNGKVRLRLFMTYDDEGQLIPTKFGVTVQKREKTDARGNPILDTDGKKQFYESAEIKSTVKPVDVSWFFKEYDKLNELFDARSAFDKWGWVVLCVCFLLLLGGFIFCAYKFGAAADRWTAASIELTRAMAVAKINGTVVNAAIV